jgi:hypothetical protein
MSSKVVVNTEEIRPVRRKAIDFPQGTVLICRNAPSGYLYAVGLVAIKGQRTSYDPPNCDDYVLQFDGAIFRAYGDSHTFYQEAYFEGAMIQRRMTRGEVSNQ